MRASRARGFLTRGIVLGSALLAAACTVHAPPPSTPDSQGVSGVGPGKEDEPFVVDWEPTELADLEAAIIDGSIAVVARDGSRIRTLERCKLGGRYERRDFPPVSGHVRFQHADGAEVSAAPPGSTARAGAGTRQASSVDFAYTVRSKAVTERTTARTSELSGECAGATHFVQAIHLGRSRGSALPARRAGRPSSSSSSRAARTRTRPARSGPTAEISPPAPPRRARARRGRDARTHCA